MRHSKLVPGASLKREKLSIHQIAELISTFYQNLAEKNPSYNLIYIISEKEALAPVINIQDSNSIQMLAEEILHQNIDDIRKFDGVDNPDINYVRGKTGGISIGLETKMRNDTFITLSYGFYPHQSSFGCIVVNEICFDTFQKAKYFLEVANVVFNVQYSAIKISDRELNKVARKYKAPLGWITYFSNDYEMPIPDDLEGVEYEYTDEGKYLILSREDISVDSDKLEASKQQLIALMQQIEMRYPAYSKRFTPPSA